MKRITKINENEYISKEVEHTTSFTGTIIELIIYLSLLAALITRVKHSINSIEEYEFWLDNNFNNPVYMNR